MSTEKDVLTSMDKGGECEATAEALFEELVEVITDTFVATYERGDNQLLMRLASGQRFCISVTKIE